VTAAVSGELAPQLEPDVSTDILPATPRNVRRMGNLTIALLLLVTAAAAGAVVYFGLPYVQ
jgi:hypothetical protein